MHGVGVAVAFLVSTMALADSTVRSEPVAGAEADWAMPSLVMTNTLGEGKDGKFFALYSDGRVLFSRLTRHDGLLLVQLSAAEMHNFLDHLPISEFRKLRKEYGYTGASHDDRHRIVSWTANGGTTEVLVFGALGREVFQGESVAPAVGPFLTIFNRLMAFDDARARPWIPKEMIVSFFGQLAPTAWPKGWPLLVKDTRYGVWCSRLDSGRRAQVLAIVGSRFFFEIPHEEDLLLADELEPSCSSARIGATPVMR